MLRSTLTAPRRKISRKTARNESAVVPSRLGATVKSGETGEPLSRSSASWNALLVSTPSARPAAMQMPAQNSVSKNTMQTMWRLPSPSMLYRLSSRLRCFIRNELV